MKKLKKIFIFIIIFQSLIGTVYAHDAIFIRSTIDKRAMKYRASLNTDKPGWIGEANHSEAQLGNFIEFKNDKDNPLSNFILNQNKLDNFIKYEKTGVDDPEKDKKTKGDSVRKGLIYTFPAKEEGSFAVATNHATSADTDRAFEIAENLAVSLNTILAMVNDGKKYDSIENLILTSIYLRPSKQIGEGYLAKLPSKHSGKAYYILYGVNPNKKMKVKLSHEQEKNGILLDSFFNYFPQADRDGNLLAYVWLGDKNSSYVDFSTLSSFVYAMPKGYIPIDGVNNGQPIVENNYDFVKKGNDTAWITIHHLAYQANFAYTNYNLTYANTSSQEKPNLNVFEKVLYELISNIFYGIRRLLGLYSIEELIYNKGTRGGIVYQTGMMAEEWWTVVLRYHLIFQVIAWTLIIGAVIKILIQINVSTINPSLRLSIMETLEKLFFVGFLLVSIIPITQLLAVLNNSIVEIFATQVSWSDSARVANHSGLLAGLIIEFIYLAINIYLNFIYIMRSIMIAILVASGPFFVVTMAFSTRGKGLFDNWSKELVANIFLQGFHAFAFAFLLNVQGVSRGIEELVIAFSLVPLTEFFRTVIFGQTGNFAISQGKLLATQSTRFATKAGEAFQKEQRRDIPRPETNEYDSNSNRHIGSNTISRNSQKLQALEKTRKVAKTGVKGAYNTGLALAKTTAGIAFQDSNLLYDGATDVRDIVRNTKENASNVVKSGVTAIGNKFKDNTGILGYKDFDKTKPIVAKEALQNRGLDMIRHKGGATLLIKDRNKLSRQDKQNIETLEKMWHDPNIDNTQLKKINGIDNMLFDKNGHITSIGYNQHALQQKLGIKNISEKDYFGQKALYFYKTNSNTPIYTFMPENPVYKPNSKDNNDEKKAE